MLLTQQWSAPGLTDGVKTARCTDRDAKGCCGWTGLHDKEQHRRLDHGVAGAEQHVHDDEAELPAQHHQLPEEIWLLGAAAAGGGSRGEHVIAGRTTHGFFF